VKGWDAPHRPLVAGTFQVTKIHAVGKNQFDLLFFSWYTTVRISKGDKVMETVATSKGQIVIPSKIRRQLGIKEETYLQIDVDEANRRLILTPVTRAYIHSTRRINPCIYDSG
jgi:AbrB family looped-hinge helix DNA binding protein